MLIGCSLLAAVTCHCKKRPLFGIVTKSVTFSVTNVTEEFFSLKSPVTGGHVTGMSIVTL
jgi:hypothetical protein